MRRYLFNLTGELWLSAVHSGWRVGWTSPSRLRSSLWRVGTGPFPWLIWITFHKINREVPSYWLKTHNGYGPFEEQMEEQRIKRKQHPDETCVIPHKYALLADVLHVTPDDLTLLEVRDGAHIHVFDFRRLSRSDTITFQEMKQRKKKTWLFFLLHKI